MDDEKMLVCPWDKNHVVRHSKFEYHVLKCKMAAGNKSTEVCPFNAKHLVKRSEFRLHIASCPDRNRLGYEQMLTHIITELPVGGVAADDKNNNSKNAHCSSAVETTSHRESSANTECEDWDAENSEVPPMPSAYHLFDRQTSYTYMKPKERKEMRENMLATHKAKLGKAESIDPNTN